ncbi:MAG TPA: dihydrofolate reductase family protein [Flavipsychrobacter sp.]
MRKLIVLSMVSLDGVMQAPGGPQEDTSGGFKYGGWVAPFFDETAGQEMAKQMYPADLLLGRKTFEIFAGYWPRHADEWPGINDVNKYVLSNTLTTSDWQNSSFLKTVADIKALKQTDGRDLQVHGSTELVKLLFNNDLVDELWLKTFPITLGKGKRLFDEHTLPAAFRLTHSVVTPAGVVMANYTRNGDIQTGDFSD